MKRNPSGVEGNNQPCALTLPQRTARDQYISWGIEKKGGNEETAPQGLQVLVRG